ncbi:peptide deformylase [Chryseomicrobium aureum]|uniref:peptide deformylase n=1 Tax=Chryseomicrobium aureum TaxID=1441723 RepID=UPI00195A8A33|nr:peptide deformylase [Chryseomicrobium aureum]MBM7705359.1 peptide deformylase [Chryseomicrobium aureum]
MTVLNIVEHPNDILTTPAADVTEFNEELGKLLDDMYETMVAADGIGLAAPQIGVSKRIAIVDMGEGQEVIEMINPQVVAIGGKEVEVEGCLSFPGLYGEVERPYYVKVEAEDRDGNLYELEAEDYEARAIQHEIDHLNGILFTSKIIRYVSPEEFMEEGEEQ